MKSNGPLESSKEWTFLVCNHLVQSQQKQDINPLFVECWSTVYDAGPALNQRWVKLSCLLGLSTIHELLAQQTRDADTNVDLMLAIILDSGQH